MKFTRFIATSTLAVLLATSAMSQDEPTADTVVATVNGTEITVGHVIALTNRLPDRFQALKDEDLFKGVVDQLIQQTALAGEQDRDRKSIRLSVENETRALLATETLSKVEAAATTEELIVAAYEEKYADAEPEMEYKASHILVETEDEAKELVTALSDGAVFADLAKEKSTGPSGPNGGDLGWTQKGRMVPEFEAAMIALEVGEVSAPTKTQFGWHVLTLVDKREKPKPALVEVRAVLVEEMKAKAIGDYMQNVEKTADIVHTELEIDPSIIRKTEILDN